MESMLPNNLSEGAKGGQQPIVQQVMPVGYKERRLNKIPANLTDLTAVVKRSLKDSTLLFHRNPSGSCFSYLSS